MAVAEGELLAVAVGQVGLGQALGRIEVPSPAAIPSGMSAVRQGATRPSRSTIRSTTSFAIRRQVVSLPPVIVSIPDEVS